MPSHEIPSNAPEKSQLGTSDNAATAATRAVRHAAEQGRAALERVGEKAGEVYDVAREPVSKAAHQLGDVALEAAGETRRYVERATRTWGRFASTHALPLAAVAASLGWLFWSMRQERSSAVDLEVRLREGALRRASPPAQPARLSTAPTTSGAKLLGVRTTVFPAP